MISKTKIKRHLRMKTNPWIVETINAAKKNKAWLGVAKLVAGSTRKYAEVNLDEIDKQTKEGDTVVIIGKVLGLGKLNKRVRVCALNFAESARKKLKEVKAEVVELVEEIKKNPKMEGIKILK